MDCRQQLINDAQKMLARLDAKAPTPAPAVMRVSSSIYSDPELFDLEKRNLFQRVPLMLAASCEIGEPGSYKTMEIAGLPLLLVRGKDGQVRAFLNACTHRGSKLARDCGSATRFTCPYHAWTFGLDGDLVGVAAREAFGQVDAEVSRLVAFPTTERAGLVWAILDPAARPAFDEFLSGFDVLLQGFGFENWHFFKRQEMAGANWKLAFDAHLEFYHLPVLHRETFGPGTSNLAEYFYYGPHQRIGLITRKEHRLEQDDLPSLASKPQDEWPLNILLFGEWIIFPNVSINCFYKGGRGVIISQVLPGADVGESVTVQFFLHEHPPEGEEIAQAHELCDFLGKVVGSEDLPMSRDQQQVLATGLLPEVQIGQNEGGVQQFHRWINRFVQAPRGATLAEIVANGENAGASIDERANVPA